MRNSVQIQVQKLPKFSKDNFAVGSKAASLRCHSGRMLQLHRNTMSSMSHLGQIKQAYPVLDKERKGQVLVRFGKSGAALAVLSVAPDHKATHRKPLWSQPYTKLVPNSYYFGPFSRQNVNAKINVENFFTFPDSCICYIRKSLPDSFIQTVSISAGLKTWLQKGKMWEAKDTEMFFLGKLN